MASSAAINSQKSQDLSLKIIENQHQSETLENFRKRTLSLVVDKYENPNKLPVDNNFATLSLAVRKTGLEIGTGNFRFSLQQAKIISTISSPPTYDMVLDFFDALIVLSGSTNICTKPHIFVGYIKNHLPDGRLHLYGMSLTGAERNVEKDINGNFIKVPNTILGNEGILDPTYTSGIQYCTIIKDIVLESFHPISKTLVNHNILTKVDALIFFDRFHNPGKKAFTMDQVHNITNFVKTNIYNLSISKNGNNDNGNEQI